MAADAPKAEPDPLPSRQLDDELDQFLADDMLDDAGEYRSPGGEAQADQLLGVLRFLSRRASEIQATADGRVEGIRKWQAERIKTIDAERSRIEHLLEGWARAQHEASGGKTVTWKLPSGELRLRPVQSKVHVLDDKESPELLRQAGLIGLLTEHPATYTVAKREVAEAAKRGAGPVVSDVLTPEPGYSVHYIPVPGTVPEDGEYLPGVSLLVPVVDRKFTAAPK